MNRISKFIETILVMLLLAAMAGCSGNDSNSGSDSSNSITKSGSLTGSGK